MATTEQTIPQSLTEVKDYFMKKGFKMIPLGPATKAPIKGFKYELLKEADYDFPLDGDENIGMAHGEASGTYAIDVDFKEKSHTVEEAIGVLFDDVKKALTSTLVIKTPKQGVHFIFKSPDGVYPEQKKYYSKNYPDVEIDIRSHNGLTVFPPSVHPEKKYGKYSFISDTLTPAELAWSNTDMVLARKGFFTKDKIDEKSPHSDKSISKLLAGGFKRGERRISENSLYCKLRISGKSEGEAANQVIIVNRKLDEPLDDKEVQYNLKYQEAFYQNHIVPSMKQKEKEKKTSGEKKTSKKDIESEASEQLSSEYNFISDISGEIYYNSKGKYHTHGEQLIKQKCRQYWEVIGIKTANITEIVNTIQDKTMILNEDQNEDIFDREYKKVTVKNGTYDFEKMKFGPHDPKLLTLIKHPIYYDESKKCPKFDKFLESCFDGDNIRITQVLEMMALCFIKKFIIQKGFVNYGIGSNGKGTFLAILRNMIGIQYTSSIPMQRFQESQFIGFELRGRCANISADGGTEPITKTGFIKGVLGGDSLRCEQKFHSPFDFMPYVTPIFTFNELPVVMDSSDGFARKIQTIHWDKRFYGKDRDPTLDELTHNTDERSGIFNKLIPIIKRLLDTRKLTYESTVSETKSVWLSRSDSFFRFKNEKIILGSKYRIEVKMLRDKYEKFCEDNGMTALRGNLFFNKISEMVDGQKPIKTRVDKEPVSFWLGFSIDSEIRTDKQEPID